MSSSTLREIESAIATQLETPMQALGVRVRVTPDTANPGVNTRGFLIVGYTGSTFSAVSSKTVGRQQRTLDFELSLAFQSLQTHKDSYDVIEAILESLTGFQPIECDGQYGQLFPARDGFVSNGDGFWRYSIIFSLITDYPNY